MHYCEQSGTQQYSMFIMLAETMQKDLCVLCECKISCLYMCVCDTSVYVPHLID